METNNLNQADLLDVFGSKGIASGVFNGKRHISKNHAVRLGKRFNVDPALFLIRSAGDRKIKSYAILY